VSGRLSATIALYLLFLAAWSALSAARSAPPSRTWKAGAALVWIALAVQAAVAALSLGGDRELEQPATFWGYLATSVVLLPLSAGRLEGAPSRAVSAALAAVMVALAVVVWRLNVVWSEA
jgi:hypothetical protein